MTPSYTKETNCIAAHVVGIVSALATASCRPAFSLPHPCNINYNRKHAKEIGMHV